MKSKTKSRKTCIKTTMQVRLPEAYPWKVLSKIVLDLKDCLHCNDFDRISKIARNRDLDSYLELAEAWGLQCISPTDTTLSEIRAKYTIACLIKKFQFSTDKEKRVARATEIFFAAESACKTYNQVSYKSLSVPETEWGVEVLHYAKQFLIKLLGDRLPGHSSLLDRSRHGPGATIGTKNGEVSQYHKYARFPYSCTIDAFRYARFAIETDQRWYGSLQHEYRCAHGIPMHMPLDMGRFWADVVDIVDGNRITFVPKDARKERTIAIEPTLNLYLQLGVDGFIRRRLKRFGVNLDSQEKNQELARLGSMPNCRQQFVTVDLSAASDSISVKLCELLLPSEWFSYLMALRSPCGELDGDLVNYEKISSMGNGYTFALESAIFTAFVYAVTKAEHEVLDRKQFAVFGDDLIVEQRYYFKLVEALRLAGFSINSEKTFSSGPIRESCGTDWFQGNPIRPVFLTTTPTDAMGVLCDYNRIKRLLSLRWGLEESETLSLLHSWVPDAAKLLVGPLSDEDFDSYVHCATPTLGRYEHCLYKYERLISMPLKVSGNSFYFRKLMHDLRAAPLPSNMWEKVSGSGGRFRVTRRNAQTLGYSPSVSDFWRSEYTEYYPPHLV